jgi:hypothetical protein
MIDPDTIQQMPANELHGLGVLADIEGEVLSFHDKDDRNHIRELAEKLAGFGEHAEAVQVANSITMQPNENVLSARSK